MTFVRNDSNHFLDCLRISLEVLVDAKVRTVKNLYVEKISVRHTHYLIYCAVLTICFIHTNKIW